MLKAKKIIESLLDKTGIKINGKEPYDIQVYNDKFYRRVLSQESIGLGESYMDGWWDCERLDEFFCKILLAYNKTPIQSWARFSSSFRYFFFNSGRKSKAFEVGEKHYDAGNDLYRAMLDKRLTYTCGYWSGNPKATTLNDAQEAKLDLVCRKIGIAPNQKILDIGSGWGSFMGYAAEKYKVKTIGVTISKKQKELADELCKHLPVETRLQDYRDINEKFDHIVSLGMFEHVGYKNYRTFMKIAHKALNDNGLFLLHTIGGNISVKRNNAWISKYIFPNSMLPSMVQISKAVEGLFIIEDVHNFGTDYDKTLMAWHGNFEKNWDKLKLNYTEKFYRMWRYYLLSCAGSFRARRNQLWQIVLSKNGVSGGYKPIR